MSTRRVGSRLKKTLQPVLVEQGFEVDKRRAVRVDGPVAVVFEVMSLSKRMANLLQLPAPSFTAMLGVDYFCSAPAGFLSELEPWPPDLGGAGVVGLLSTSADFAARHAQIAQAADRADVWPVLDDDGADVAVDDLVEAWRCQAEPLLRLWSDLDAAYERLLTIENHIETGGPGRPEVRLPGVPGSINREEHLAVLAALRDAPADEAAHLQNLLELSADGRYRTRLAVIES